MMKSKTVGFLTLGCKVNTYETDAMAALFSAKGYQVVEGLAGADICIINTCTVTNLSDRKSRQALRRAKKENPDTLVVAAGCYVQVARDKVKELPEVDVLLGNGAKSKAVEVVEAYLEGDKATALNLANRELKEYDKLSMERSMTTRAFIKVQDGCQQFCSYCIIPYARGPVRSRPIDEVVKEVENLSTNGVKEVVISGIHVASYGKDTKTDWVELVEQIAARTSIERIRLSSMEAGGVTEEGLDRLAKTGKLCHHFHLSLQSGSDEVLKAMNRHYSTEEFLYKMELIRSVFPRAGITTDIIVGFPGETETLFQETLAFVEKAKFSRLHVFPFSARKGTPAAMRNDQLSMDIKKQRAKSLIKLGNKLEDEFIASELGKPVQVLLEQPHDGVDKHYIGYASNYIRCTIPALKEELGSIVDGQIISNREHIAFCERRSNND